MSSVGLLEVLTNPDTNVYDIWVWVSRRFPACVQLREPDTEANIVDVLIWDHLVRGSWDWRVHKEFEKCFASVTPTFLVPVTLSDGCCVVRVGRWTNFSTKAWELASVLVRDTTAVLRSWGRERF